MVGDKYVGIGGGTLQWTKDSINLIIDAINNDEFKFNNFFVLDGKYTAIYLLDFNSLEKELNECNNEVTILTMNKKSAKNVKRKIDTFHLNKKSNISILYSK